MRYKVSEGLKRVSLYPSELIHWQSMKNQQNSTKLGPNIAQSPMPFAMLLPKINEHSSQERIEDNPIDRH